jgi:hypothetical protein
MWDWDYDAGMLEVARQLPPIIEAQAENVRHSGSFVQEKHFMLDNTNPERPRRPLTQWLARPLATQRGARV